MRKYLEDLWGQKVTDVSFSDELCVLDTELGQVVLTVEGECCSYSYFHDAVGLDHLRNNGAVLRVETIDLGDDSADEHGDTWTSVYGIKIVTEHPMFGEVNTVISFRNDSNGYYGGECDSRFEGDHKLHAGTTKASGDHWVKGTL